MLLLSISGLLFYYLRRCTCYNSFTGGLVSVSMNVKYIPCGPADKITLWKPLHLSNPLFVYSLKHMNVQAVCLSFSVSFSLSLSTIDLWPSWDPPLSPGFLCPFPDILDLDLRPLGVLASSLFCRILCLFPFTRNMNDVLGLACCNFVLFCFPRLSTL